MSGEDKMRKSSTVSTESSMSAKMSLVETAIHNHPDIQNWPEPVEDIDLGRCLGDGAYVGTALRP